MKRVTSVTPVICILLAAIALVACGDDDDRTTIIQPPAPLLPTVECCDFTHQDKCRDIPVARLEKLIRRGDACFDHGRCFTGCPDR